MTQEDYEFINLIYDSFESVLDEIQWGFFVPQIR